MHSVFVCEKSSRVRVLTNIAGQFLMTTLLVFVYPGSPAQLAAGAMITFIFLVINLGYRPYCTASLNSLKTFCLIAQFLTRKLHRMTTANTSPVGLIAALLAFLGKARDSSWTGHSPVTFEML